VGKFELNTETSSRQPGRGGCKTEKGRIMKIKGVAKRNQRGRRMPHTSLVYHRGTLGVFDGQGLKKGGSVNYRSGKKCLQSTSDETNI